MCISHSTHSFPNWLNGVLAQMNFLSLVEDVSLVQLITCNNVVFLSLRVSLSVCACACVCVCLY